MKEMGAATDKNFALTQERVDKIAAELLATGSPEVYVKCLPCPHCKEFGHVTMPVEAYVAWLRGSHIQDCWPEGTPDEHEMLMTGTHGACWDRIFDEDEARPSKEEDE